MTVRVGVDTAVEESLLTGFTAAGQIVRIAEQPQGEIAIDFWVPALPPKIVRHQWPHLKGVRVVQAPWAGVDALLGLFPPDVVLCDARGVHDIPTAEWAVGAILAMQKSLPFFMEMQREGQWAAGQQAQQIDTPAQTKTKTQRQSTTKIQSETKSQSETKIKNPPAPMHEVADATVLIVGYGSIGKAIEARLTPFGANFIRVSRTAHESVNPVSKLDDLLPEADVVVLIIPLTSETRHLMDRNRLAKMKPGALLVNASRGPIVETEALLEVLIQDKIRAAIDVTDPEPLPEGHPLWKAPNLLLTPHVAGDSDRFMGRAFKLISEQVDRFARGEPLLNVVTGEY